MDTLLQLVECAQWDLKDEACLKYPAACECSCLKVLRTYKTSTMIGQ